MVDDPKGFAGNEADNMHPMAKLLFGWVTAPKAGMFILWGLVASSIALIAADFFIPRHPHTEAESYLGFYGVYGFCAFAFVALMGWPLGRLLRRPENYYEDQDDGEEGQ